MTSRVRHLLLLAFACLLAACAAGRTVPPGRPAVPAGPSEGLPDMNRIAESYVRLVLAVGQHDPDYVDAYYGPPQWRTEAEAGKRPMAEIRSEAAGLIAALAAQQPASPGAPGPEGSETELLALRHDYLARQLGALVARVDQLAGKKMSFDEESKALYDAVAPTYGDEHFARLSAELATVLPGDGPLGERLEQFRHGFVIARDRLGPVFDAAIAECRRRTRQHVELPPGESFEVEYVSGRPWSAYNWYKGSYHSLIQVNTELPIHIDRAIDLACHEGYPGHHVYNALLEERLVRGRGWNELAVYPLFSPQSLIAEGTANFGIEVAFPGDERVEFEKRVLFPLAGLDATAAERYYRVQAIVQKLSYAGNEAARRYLDGKIDREQAIDWLVRYALSPRDRAEQRLRFIERYRSYVINYNFGQDLVRDYIERRGGTADHPDRRWAELARLISSPRLPSGLAPSTP